jgi:NADP-dependent 3-hydroxy acid dehydrogenase YdfG
MPPSPPVLNPSPVIQKTVSVPSGFGQHLNGAVVLVTGASRGIGAAIARALDGYDPRFILVARNLDDLQAVAATLQSPVHCVQADLTQPDAIGHVFKETLALYGRLDVLVNNAGVGGKVGLLNEVPPEDIARMVHLNLLAPMLLARQAVQCFVSQGSPGHIVNINSIAGKTAFPYWAVYDATKAGLKAFSEALQEEQRHNGTRVLSVYPGACDTDIWDSVDLAQDASPDRSGMLAPDDVANAVVYALAQPPHILMNDITLMPTAPAL